MQNDPLDRVCSKCGGDGRAAIAGAFIDGRMKGPGIPETQAEAALKEAAVDGKGREIKVAFSKGIGFEATLHISGSGEAWRVGWDFRCKAAGESSRDPDTYACEEGAAAAGFERLKLWLTGVRESTPSLASKVRKAIAEAGIHEARAIGAWLKQHKTEFQSPKKAAAPTASKPAVPLAARVNSAPVVHLDLARIQQSPENMRTDFDEASLQELADSIKSHGLGQPIMVVAVGEGWELIAGERRYRASKLAKLTSIPARVIDCSPAEARELRLIENLKRKDLSAIEEARGYQTLLQENGYTQQQLGDQIGVHQSTIANRLRLLRLPAVLQDMVIRREITESHARHLVDMPDHPTMAAHLAKAIAEEIRDEGGLPSLSDWPRWLFSAAKEIARSVEPKSYYSYRDKKGAYCSGNVAFTEKHLGEYAPALELVSLKAPWEKKPERFALNLKKWEELHAPLAKAAADREAARSSQRGKKPASKGPKVEPTAAELAPRKKEQAEQLAKKIAGYRNRWLQHRCSAACPKLQHEQGIKLLIGFGGMTDQQRRRRDDLMAAIKEVGGKAVTAQYDQRPMLSVLALPDEKILAVAKAALGRWLAQPVEDYAVDLNAVDLPAIAQLLDVDVARDWRLDEEFLLLHTKDQLAALFSEWKLIGPLQEKRTDIIKEALAANTNNQLPAPKALLKGGK